MIVSPTCAVTVRPSSASLRPIESEPVEDGPVEDALIEEGLVEDGPVEGALEAEGDVVDPQPAVAPSSRAKTRPVHRRGDGFTATVWLALVPGRPAP